MNVAPLSIEFAKGVRRTARNLLRIPEKRAAIRAAKLLTPSSKNEICYLTPEFPKFPDEALSVIVGGAVKLSYLNNWIRHNPAHAKYLYTVSSVDHQARLEIVRTAKSRGLKIILNQNGVYYRAWYGDGWEKMNEPLAELHQLADAVFYQSEFCRTCATKFLGDIKVPQSVAFNPVPLDQFYPDSKSGKRLRILTPAASRWRAYRVQLAIEVVGELVRQGYDCELFVPGYSIKERSFVKKLFALAKRNGLDESRFIVAAEYSRAEAPGIFRSAHMLLHTVYNDPSPNVVGEALASGLPVVYSSSGGVPEIVGADAGIGVATELNWDELRPPTAEIFTSACKAVLNNLASYSVRARTRAESALSLDNFYKAHKMLLALCHRRDF